MDPPLPSTAGAIILEIGLLGWIAALVLLTRRGFRPNGRFTGRPGLIAIGLAALFYSVWLAAVRFL